MARRLATALVTGALLLAGCSSSPSEDEPAPTAPASPTDAPPTMPELALDDSPAGAEAFVRHYIDVLNHAALTGDTSALEELSSPECSGCDRYVDLFRTTYANGGYFKGGEWEIEELSIEYDAAQEEQYVTTAVKIRDGLEKSSSRTDEVRTPASESTVTFGVHDGDHRRISQLGLGGLQ